MKHLISKKYCVYFLILFCIVFISCKQNPSSLTETDINVIEKYLDNKLMPPSFGGTVFSAHKILQTDKNKIYLWAYLQEYYKNNGRIELGSGWSVPLVLNIEGISRGIIVKSHSVPGDGELYAHDIKKLFPKELHQKICDFSGTQEIQRLELLTKKRAEKYLN